MVHYNIVKEAIDQLSNKIVSAEQFYGQPIRDKRSRFVCKYCGENVRYRPRGGKQPDYFFHLKKTKDTAECEKRIAQLEQEAEFYQRVGIPMCLKDEGKRFYLYLMFPPLGDGLVDQAKKQKAKIIISDGTNSNNFKEYSITPYRFCDEVSTPITVKFIPCGEESKYVIKIVSEDIATRREIEKKWADYSDGFTKSGAIFNYNDFGDNRIRFNSDISADKLYYLVSNDSEAINQLIELQVSLEEKGYIALGNYNYCVYLLNFGNNLTSDKGRYESVKRLIYSKFRVSLTDSVTKLNLLWPPAVVERDVNIPVKNTDSIYCGFSGSNQILEVGFSNDCVKVDKNNNIIMHSIAQNETIIYVEANGKLQLNNSLIINKKHRKELVGVGAYEFSLSKDSGEVIKLSKLKSDSLRGNCLLRSNAKMNVYVKDRRFHYYPNDIRDSEKNLSGIKGLAEIICVVEKGIQLVYLVNNACDELESEEFILKRIISTSFGEYVTAPMWFTSLLLKWQREKKYELVFFLKRCLVEGKVPCSLLNALLKLKLQKIY